VGIPLGIAGGRWAWQLFANQAGLDPGTITPLPVLWMIPATLAVAALVALPPARSVARIPAAATLRSELSRTAADWFCREPAVTGDAAVASKATVNGGESPTQG
jgi:predicted lysophospholipase L1 biosynthesis ABC-type transport system permease subunit